MLKSWNDTNTGLKCKKACSSSVVVFLPMMVESFIRYEQEWTLQTGVLVLTHQQSPILLALDSVLPTYNVFPQATQIVYILADLLSAEAIIRLVQSGESTSTRLFTSTRKSSKASDTAVAAA